MSRNLVEYPVTVKEIADHLQRLIGAEKKGDGIGDMGWTMLEEARKRVLHSAYLSTNELGLVSEP